MVEQSRCFTNGDAAWGRDYVNDLSRESDKGRVEQIDSTLWSKVCFTNGGGAKCTALESDKRRVEQMEPCARSRAAVLQMVVVGPRTTQCHVDRFGSVDYHVWVSHRGD
jgi:hypothetical protein